MEFRDLKSQYQVHKSAIDRAISRVVNEADFISGNSVRELENELADYVGVKHCISCANGTDALQLALMAWNIGPGDAVFVPDFTFFSSGEVVSAVGATPVFVDVKEETFNIDPDKLEEAVKNVIENEPDLNPRAIIAVDLFGQPAEYPRIREVSERYNLLILEDGAQGFGGSIRIEGKEHKACSFGDISTTSFFPAKPLGCYGDGGAIFTNNDEWATLIRSLTVHGKGNDKYDNIRIGMNSRLDTIQAAVLLEKLRFFDEEVDRCNQVAKKYGELFSNVGEIVTPKVLKGYQSSWAQYTILVPDSDVRRKIMEKLKEESIPSMIYYKKPMHKQGAFSKYSFDDLKYTVTETICNRCISLPMSAFVREEEIETISLLILNSR